MGRRQLLTAVTMLALTGILVLGASWGWKALFAEVPGLGLTVEEPVAKCTPEQVEAGGKLRARQVQVSVYNGGTRSGLAGETLDALVKRGFADGEVGNAPSKVNVRRVQVWTTTKGDPAARLVALQFGKDVKVTVTEEDLGAGVDVLVGNEFERLRRAPRAIKVGKAQELCVPVPTPSPTE